MLSFIYIFNKQSLYSKIFYTNTIVCEILHWRQKDMTSVPTFVFLIFFQKNCMQHAYFDIYRCDVGRRILSLQKCVSANLLIYEMLRICVTASVPLVF